MNPTSTAPTTGVPAYPPSLCPDPPDISHLVIDDGAPVDGIHSEKQMRLLTEPLYSSWKGPGEGRPFVALANVGLFLSVKEPPIVPDVMLAVDVRADADTTRKENLSYFVWLRGKVPDAGIEIVSNREGGEDGPKKKKYAQFGVRHYIIFDPEHHLGPEVLRGYTLHGYHYVPDDLSWLPDIGLGLKVWQGTFEGWNKVWLRWCDQNGRLIPTGDELSRLESHRADQEKQRADQESRRADQESRRADLEKERAEQERQRAERLAEQLRQAGLDPQS